MTIIEKRRIQLPHAWLSDAMRRRPLQSQVMLNQVTTKEEKGLPVMGTPSTRLVYATTEPDTTSRTEHRFVGAAQRVEIVLVCL